MKWLKIIGFAIVALIALFFSLGVFVPQYEYESTVTVNAPREKCWKIYHSPSLMGQWMRGFESLTLKKGDSLAVGSEYEIVIVDGERMEMREHITAVNPFHSVSYELTNDVLTSEYTFYFEGEGNTRIRAHYKVTGNNIILKSMLLLFKGAISSSSQEQLNLLKKAIEKEP
jgi:uncharacterized protein YndB with AHSA1/START domain